jgi:hypothetical protein
MKNRILFSSLMSLGVGLNPITLGQPSLYYQSFDTSYLTPSSPISGDPITLINRYSDNGVTISGNTGSEALWYTLAGKEMMYFPGIDGAFCWPPPCTGTTPSLYLDETTNLGFMYNTGYSYTFYFVGKPLSKDGAIFTTFVDDGLGGNNLGINFDVNTNNIRLAAGRPAPGFSTLPLYEFNIETSIDSNDLESKPLRVFSVRGEDVGSGNTTTYGYVNGIQTVSTIQLNNTVFNPHTYPLGIGSNPGGFDQFSHKGYFGELIIFNTVHDLTTHNEVVNFLKNRWGIN